MLKELISQGDFAIWPQISLLLFLSTFTGILLWVRRRGLDKHYQYMADMTVDGCPKEQNHE